MSGATAPPKALPVSSPSGPGLRPSGSGAAGPTQGSQPLRSMCSCEPLVDGAGGQVWGVGCGGGQPAQSQLREGDASLHPSRPALGQPSGRAQGSPFLTRWSLRLTPALSGQPGGPCLSGEALRFPGSSLPGQGHAQHGDQVTSRRNVKPAGVGPEWTVPSRGPAEARTEPAHPHPHVSRG